MCSKTHSKRNRSPRGVKQTREMFSWLAFCESNWKRMQAAPKVISLITNHCFWITVQIWFTALNLTLNKWVVMTFNSNQKGVWQESRKASTNHFIPFQKLRRQLSFSGKRADKPDSASMYLLGVQVPKRYRCASVHLFFKTKAQSFVQIILWQPWLLDFPS